MLPPPDFKHKLEEEDFRWLHFTDEKKKKRFLFYFIKQEASFKCIFVKTEILYVLFSEVSISDF